LNPHIATYTGGDARNGYGTPSAGGGAVKPMDLLAAFERGIERVRRRV
jgi:hypothetical protein